MKTPKLKAVELTRRIRDQHYEQLKGETHAERIAFYQERAHALHTKIRATLHEQHDIESEPR